MRRKASITVFAALSLMLVAQLLFTLLEAARHYELQKVLYMNTDTVLESVFADYCSPLWETYKILGVRVEDTKGKLCFNNREAQLRGLTSDHLGSKEQKTLLSGMSLLTAEMTDARYDPYRLLTDQNGVVFQKAVCTYMKKNIAYEMAKSVYNHYEAVKEVNLSADLKKFDEGIDKKLNLDKLNISGGQRQKIVLARAKVHDSDIILIDEGTSAIDQKATMDILNNLLKSKATIVFIV